MYLFKEVPRTGINTEIPTTINTYDEPAKNEQLVAVWDLCEAHETRTADTENVVEQ